MIDAHIQKTIEEILKRMDVSYTSISISESELPGYKKFSIESGDSSLLIGREGVNLQALSYLVRKLVDSFVNEHSSDYRFFVDVGNYEVARIRRVQDVARTMADRARTFERDVEMEPMDAYDRMIVHTTLDGYKDITTESEGEKNYRKVIIRFKSE